MIKDDLISYLLLCKNPNPNPNSELVAETLARCIKAFPAMKIWISDRGTHFKNEVMKLLAEDYRIHQTFTTTYSPLSNGAVESVNRNVTSACPTLSTELKSGAHDF